MPSSYFFDGPFGRCHVVPRGAPAPMDGVRASVLRLQFVMSGQAGEQNERERMRMLGDLGFSSLRAGALDTGERLRAVDRLCDQIEHRFDVYEVRRRAVVIPLDLPADAILGPDSKPVDVDPKTWIALTLVDQNGVPVPNRPYRVVKPDGTTLDGVLDSNGAAMIKDLDPGNCQITCPYVEPHGPLTVTAQDGDHASGIAEAQGFDDVTMLWNDGGNADLAGQRADPHVLQPGDTVAVPELKAQPAASKPTGAKHPFTIQRSPLKLRFKLFDLAVKAVAGAAVTVADTPLTTGGDGLVETDVDKSAKDVAATLPAGDVDLALGGLNPSDDTSDAGWKARLFNMGYLWDPSVDDDDDEMVIALQDFQAQASLSLTGQLDDATKAQIAQTYGC